MTAPDFNSMFAALWKSPTWEEPKPFGWQSMLAERARNGDWPEAINLPTASGKTACLDVAVFALAHYDPAARVERRMPRRIWFIVDRRIVVDAAFDRARQLADKLLRAQTGPLKEIADRLRALSGTERPLAVARLRGGAWRDDSWARLPSQPAIICSTVDQVGSALLFRSYGHSDRTASIWAGLAANDSLILLDEAHCAVPFLQTLRAIDAFREAPWASAPIKTPFRFSILSATPPADIPTEASFPQPDERPGVLNDPMLQARLGAPKPATLLMIKGKGDLEALIEAASSQAGNFLENGCQRIAVMANRVATAEAIAAQIVKNKAVGGRATVILLTGRMRPLDRDALVTEWSPQLKAGSRGQPAKPIILVTTQCLEVGADFSFDALVTECASLDALRQRFGRLNRLGEFADTRATILIRKADATSKNPDPIYGEALAKTWLWLSENATPGAVKDTQEINFGIQALDAQVNSLRARDEERFQALLAPTANAPILLPAHLDLLCQTAPRPVPEPDVSLFLHGTQRGAPEVRVLWRADLPETVAPAPSRKDEDLWLETLSLLPPSSPEMLTVPLYRLRRWLAEDHSGKTDDADIEGLPEEPASEKDETLRHHARSAFCLWRGRDRAGERHSLLTRDVRAIRAGDVVVLPAELGIAGLGQTVPHNPDSGAAQLDLAERAARQARGRVVLRLNRKRLGKVAQQPALAVLLKISGTAEPEPRELEEALLNLGAAAALPENAGNPPLSSLPWLVEHARLLAKDGFQAEAHPAGGLILTGKKLRLFPDGETEDDPLADDEDATSAGENPVTLRDHSAAVQTIARDFATRCLGPDFAELYGAAGYTHDFGKLDPRFQFFLHNGDEIVAGAEPLAKSAHLPERRRRRRDLREDGQLPEGFRHEFLSAQLAEHAGLASVDPHARDLFLHLLGSHHGHARPFAPIAPDPFVAAGKTADLSLTPLQCEATLTAARRAELPAPHELRAGVPDRFWRLNRRHGWWGLAYLEAILRLADWHASLHPDAAPRAEGKRPSSFSPSPNPTTVRPPPNELPFDALDGANPLAFLAALGTLRLLARAEPTAAFRLSWKQRLGAWRPVLHFERALTPATVVDLLYANGLNLDQLFTTELLTATPDAGETNKEGETHRQDKLQFTVSAFRAFCLAARRKADCPLHEFAAAWAGETAPKVDKGNKVSFARKTRFDFTAGKQAFIKMLRDLREAITPEDIRRTLFEGWRYSARATSMRWDPQDEKRQYAVQAVDPTNGTRNPPLADAGANFLAVEAIPLFPLVPDRKANQPGFVYAEKDNSFRWSLWYAPLSLDSIRSLLTLPLADPDRWPPTHRRALGITTVFVARIVSPSERYRSFTPARAV